MQERCAPGVLAPARVTPQFQSSAAVAPAGRWWPNSVASLGTGVQCFCFVFFFEEGGLIQGGCDSSRVAAEP